MLTELPSLKVYPVPLRCPNIQDKFKRALIQFADSEGPDQPARMRRLIWAFVVRLQNQWI